MFLQDQDDTISHEEECALLAPRSPTLDVWLEAVSLTIMRTLHTSQFWLHPALFRPSRPQCSKFSSISCQCWSLKCSMQLQFNQNTALKSLLALLCGCLGCLLETRTSMVTFFWNWLQVFFGLQMHNYAALHPIWEETASCLDSTYCLHLAKLEDHLLSAIWIAGQPVYAISWMISVHFLRHHIYDRLSDLCNHSLVNLCCYEPSRLFLKTSIIQCGL